jgi:hypothetical protein
MHIYFHFYEGDVVTMEDIVSILNPVSAARAGPFPILRVGGCLSLQETVLHLKRFSLKGSSAKVNAVGDKRQTGPNIFS